MRLPDWSKLPSASTRYSPGGQALKAVDAVAQSHRVRAKDWCNWMDLVLEFRDEGSPLIWLWI